MATINSLGIGSNVLTSDVIEKLRANDESSLITPLDKKIESTNLKLTSFKLLDSLMDTFQSSVSKLSMDSLFLARSVSGSTDAATVTAESGSDVQSFTLSNISIAQAEVEHSANTFSSKTSALTTTPGSGAIGSGTLTLAIDGKSFNVDYTSATSLSTLATSINDAAGDKVTASILKVGTDKYELVIKSNTVGANQAITFSDSLSSGGIPDSNSLMSALGMTNIQAARDATFKYNGISITRSTNEITDLLNGVTISLKQNQETGESANIAITQNKTEINTEMSLFVQNYNALVTNLSDMTAYDKDAGKVGVFNGENFIKSISREINDIITSVNKTGISLMDYGISIDKEGVMSLDNSTFETKMAEDPLSLETFFSGDSKDEGIFDTLYTKTKNYTGYQKQLDNFNNNLNSSLEKLTEDRAKMVERLDARYEIMSKRFIAYDAMISKLNTQFASLQQQIEMATAN